MARIHAVYTSSLVLPATLSACLFSPELPPFGAASESTGAGTSGTSDPGRASDPGSTAAAPTTTTGEPTTGPVTSTPATGTTVVDTTGPENGGTSGTEESDCDDTPNQPIDSSCTDQTGCGCDTQKCFVVPVLGGFCGECLVDADCDKGGCSVPNPIAGVGATCNMGGPGDGCMSDAVCADPANGTCGVLLNFPGIFTVATCGQCEVNADCTDPALANCRPTYIIEDFKGKLDCVADASVENNFGCSLEDVMGQPAGNKACKSGFCGEASFMGLLKLGICGECNADSDCPMGMMCTDPKVDVDNGTLIGSVCM
jgi:hypothetical protein